MDQIDLAMELGGADMIQAALGERDRHGDPAKARVRMPGREERLVEYTVVEPLRSSAGENDFSEREEFDSIVISVRISELGLAPYQPIGSETIVSLPGDDGRYSDGESFGLSEGGESTVDAVSATLRLTRAAMTSMHPMQRRGGR